MQLQKLAKPPTPQNTNNSKIYLNWKAFDIFIGLSESRKKNNEW